MVNIPEMFGRVGGRNTISIKGSFSSLVVFIIRVVDIIISPEGTEIPFSVQHQSPLHQQSPFIAMRATQATAI